jgi:hypothetical protein
MNSIAAIALATALIGAAFIYPQKLTAQDFTGQRFLEWSETDQRNYIFTQLVMAASIAARIRPELSTCISDAFVGSAGLSDRGYGRLMSRIGEFETYHPSSVIVVTIEDACGPFN